MDKQKQISELRDLLYGYWNSDIVIGDKYEVISEALVNIGYRKIPKGAVVLTKEEYEKKESDVRKETLNEVYAAILKIPTRNAGTKARILNEIEKLGVKNGGSLKEVISNEFKAQSSDLVQFLMGVIENLQQHINYLSNVYGKEDE